MANNCDNCGHCYIEQVIHVCGRNEGRLPLFDGDGNCKGWKQKHLVNADRIKAMSDMEIASFFYWDVDGSGKTQWQWLEWLRQECE